MKQVFFFFFFSVAIPVLLMAQLPDTTVQKKDSVSNAVRADSVLPQSFSLRTYLANNKLLNSSGTPVYLPVKERKPQGKDAIFYMLACLVLMLAFFRYFFARYFSNLFQVFFNTSLRQSQLTDQLLQAKLPSLLFNIFFVVSAGFYVYSLLIYYHWISSQNSWLPVAICTGAIGMVYLVKFCTLKFTGWLTGHSDITNMYIFIVFLINKIIGIFLVPLVILMTFSEMTLVNIAAVISLLLIGFMLVLRFLRSYGIMQNQLKISRFHFILYIVGIELLPLLLIYKGLMILLSKNL